MGLAGLGVPEQLGGAGGGLAELTVVAEELGRALLPVPFLSSTVVGGQLLIGCPDAPAAVLGDLAGGAALVSFAGLDEDGCWRADRVPVRATESDGWQLDGVAQFVLDGTSATHLVVAAAGPHGCDLYLLAADSSRRRARARSRRSMRRAARRPSPSPARGPPR